MVVKSSTIVETVVTPPVAGDSFHGNPSCGLQRLGGCDGLLSTSERRRGSYQTVSLVGHVDSRPAEEEEKDFKKKKKKKEKKEKKKPL